MDTNERDSDWVSAYLEWTETGCDQALEPEALECLGVYLADTWSDIDEQHSLLESILQTALRTEAECVQIARRALDLEDASAAMRDAYDALSYAERLLQDERQAWRVLHRDFTHRWPHPLLEIDADVRRLTRRVSELHAL